MSVTVSLLSGLAILSFVSSQGYFEEHRHLAQPSTLDSIPKQFEIRDIQKSNPSKEFEKYAEQIHHLAKRENVSVLYKVKVEIVKKLNGRGNAKKYNMKKINAKKYNIPLKKNSMKLSNFEVFLRKTAEGNKMHYPNSGGSNHYLLSTLEPNQATKTLHTKYKPVLSKLNNFSKVIRPVRNRIITLS